MVLEECIATLGAPFLEILWLGERRMVLMWDTLDDDLWSLGHGRKNPWHEGLWERPLNATIGSPMAFQREPSVALEAV